MPPALIWPHSGQPEVMVAGRFAFARGTLAREYRHPTVALHWHHYTGRVWIGGARMELRPGDLTLTPPRTVSRYELDRDGYHLCIHFRPLAVRGPALRLPLHLPAPVGAPAAEMMRAVMEGFDRSEALDRAAAGTLVQALLLRLAVEQRRGRLRPASRSGARLDAARERIDQRLRGAVDLTQIARASGLSRNYFSARFRERFGLSPRSYLLRRRIETARMLLVTTDLPLKEIAFECGLPDPRHFNKQFRLVAGTSPSAYRARHREKW